MICSQSVSNQSSNLAVHIRVCHMGKKDVPLKIVVKHLAIGIPEIIMKSLVNIVTVR